MWILLPCQLEQRFNVPKQFFVYFLVLFDNDLSVQVTPYSVLELTDGPQRIAGRPLNSFQFIGKGELHYSLPRALIENTRPGVVPPATAFHRQPVPRPENARDSSAAAVVFWANAVPAAK